MTVLIQTINSKWAYTHMLSLLQLHHYLRADILLEEKCPLQTFQQRNLDLIMISLLATYSCMYNVYMTVYSLLKFSVFVQNLHHCKDTMILWSSSSLGYGFTASDSSLVGQSTPLGNAKSINTTLYQLLLLH